MSEQHDRFRMDVRKAVPGLSFPIRDAEELVRQLGGERAVLRWHGTQHQVGQAVKVVPAYYFPIESQDDLENKAMNLELLRPGTPLAMKEVGYQLDSSFVAGEPPGALNLGAPLLKGRVSQGGPCLPVGSRRKHP